MCYETGFRLFVCKRKKNETKYKTVVAYCPSVCSGGSGHLKTGRRLSDAGQLYESTASYVRGGGVDRVPGNEFRVYGFISEEAPSLLRQVRRGP